MLRNTYLPHMLGTATLAVLFSAASVHPQTTGQDPASTTGAPTSRMPGQSSGSNASPASGASSTASDQAGGKLSKADQNLMRELAFANISEIEAGKLAQKQSKNEQVRNFAQRMIDDHTKAQDELQKLAQSKGVTLPSEPDSKHKMMMKQMSALSGAEFDRKYMAQGGVTDHRNTHRLLQRVQKRASDPDLKALAEKTMPTVDQHLTMAQQMTGKGGAQRASGASGTSGGGGAKGSGAAKGDSGKGGMESSGK